MDDLRRLAEAATPGPLSIMRYKHGGGRIHKGDNLIADLYEEADREFYAAWNPQTALALLDRLAAAESQQEALRQIAVIENTRIRCVNHGGDVGMPGECACGVALDSGEKAREIARAALKEQPREPGEEG